jgi:hypothetical protein
VGPGREETRIRDAAVDQREAVGLVEALRREHISHARRGPSIRIAPLS